MSPVDPASPAISSVDDDRALAAELRSLHQRMLDLERQEGSLLQGVQPHYQSSARNLLHFIAFYRQLHPGLQRALRQRGLSTLEGCDGHLLHTLTAVLAHLDAPPVGEAGDSAAASGVEAPEPLDQRRSEALLADHCDRLFGAGSGQACPAIMVTLPRAAADHPNLIQELVEAGMTIARINAAHDDAAIWQRLVEQVRQASRRAARPCRISLDLAGPKVRTGPLPPLAGVVDGRPQRDRFGRLEQPFRLLAVPEPLPLPLPLPELELELELEPGWVALPVQGTAIEQLSRGDCLRGRDASGRLRELIVLEHRPQGLLLAGRQRCRFIEGLTFVQEGGAAVLTVAPLPPVPGELLLRPGEHLRLTGEPVPAPDAISCSLPALLRDVRVGERVLFDDGRIAAVIEAVSETGGEEVRLRVIRARGRGSRLRADQGINLPDSQLQLPALTAKDRTDLAFATTHADLISYSFVQTEQDLDALHGALAACGAEGLAVVLKIETRRAFETLPRLLLAAMRWPAPLGVMIARGDLAIECGWEAMAAIQEEILQVCAAAHVPCIWATQVLDAMAHHGTPTRAEITDAAMGARAEALMLNKGPNITATVRSLQRIIGPAQRASPDRRRRPEVLLSCRSFALPE